MRIILLLIIFFFFYLLVIFYMHKPWSMLYCSMDECNVFFLSFFLCQTWKHERCFGNLFWLFFLLFKINSKKQNDPIFDTLSYISMTTTAGGVRVKVYFSCYIPSPIYFIFYFLEPYLPFSWVFFYFFLVLSCLSILDTHYIHIHLHSIISLSTELAPFCQV